MNSNLTTSVDATSTPAAYIMSHSTFNFGQHHSRYPNDITLSILLSRFPNSTVLLKVEFIYINIGDESNCRDNNTTGDILTIVTPYGNIFTCSDVNDAINIQTQVIHLQSPKFVGFRFETNSQHRRGGFLLKYSGL